MVEVAGGPVEIELVEGRRDLAPLVFLHEGLGSIDLWRGFPDDVRVATGSPTTLVYSRHGYGRSAPAELPRPVGYMHHEADVVLPALLAALGIERPVLIGHSDGASIALLHAGSIARPELAGLVCLAPHVFVEPESIVGIAEARSAFETSDLADRMARYHDDPVATFRGWNDVWSSAAFEAWDITDRLGGITDPVLCVQGTADQYGTVHQVDAIAAGVAGRCERLVLDDVGHAPHLERRAEVVAAIDGFLASEGGAAISAG
ncbi:MAG: alpha/beta hydrolase [Ilumatobacter sp.]|nr:alpha/beta hydrolase [Ilumatobacter sp.]